MSLIIKEVHLWNIRSHQDYTFSPAEKGITALSGPNGSGKSTVVDSIAWALFGKRPAGVRKSANLARDGFVFGEGDDPYVELTLSIDGTDVKVRRSINSSGLVTCDVEERNGENDPWVHRAGPAVRSANGYIRKRLKMDESGFLTSVFVQQKQVDQIVTASPAERQSSIEKLIGVAAITEARKEAATEKKLRDDRVKNSLYSPSEYAAAERQAEKFETVLSSAASKLDAAEIKMVAARDNFTSKETLLRGMEEQRDRVSALSRSIDRSTDSIELLRERMVTVESEKNEKRRQINEYGSLEDLQEASRRVRVYERKIREISAELGELRSKAKRFTSMLSGARSIIDGSEYRTESEAKKRLLTVENGLSSLEASIEEHSALISDLRSSIRSIKKAEEVISNNEACPTCLQTVDDTVDAMAAFEESIQSMEKSIAGYQSKVKKSRESVQRGIKARADITAVIEAIASTGSLEEELMVSNDRISALEEEEVAISAELDALRSIAVKAKMVAEDRKSYDRLLKEAQDISDKIEDHTRTVNDAKAELKSLKVKDEAYLARARTKVESLRGTYEELRTIHQELDQTVVLATRDLEHANRELKRLADERERFENDRDQQIIANQSIALLKELYTTRMSEAIPVVEAYTSDFVNAFSNGKFRGVKLDGKLNVTVQLAAGGSRPIGLLSGGELSATALALRLAVSILMSKAAGSTTIILDEVFVSHDSEKSEKILSVIKDLFKGQVILISHGSNTREIADTVVELGRNVTQ